MSLIECKKHGTSFIISTVEKNIVDSIINNETIKDKMIFIIKIFINDENNDRFQYRFQFYISAKTFFKEDFQRTYEIYWDLSDESFEDEENCIIDILHQKTRVVCEKCFDEFIQRYDIKMIDN